MPGSNGGSETRTTVWSAVSTCASALSTWLPAESRMTAELNAGSSLSLNLSTTSFGADLTVPPSAGVARTRWAWANAAATPDKDSAADAAVMMIACRGVIAKSPEVKRSCEHRSETVSIVEPHHFGLVAIAPDLRREGAGEGQHTRIRIPTHRIASHRSNDASRSDHASFPDDPHGSLRAGPGGHGDRHCVPRCCRSLPHGHGGALRSSRDGAASALRDRCRRRAPAPAPLAL